MNIVMFGSDGVLGAPVLMAVYISCSKMMLSNSAENVYFQLEKNSSLQHFLHTFD